LLLKRSWAAAWRVAALLILLALISAPFLVPMTDRLAAWRRASPVMAQLYADAVGVLATAAAVAIMTILIDRRRIGSIGFTRKHTALTILLGVTLGASWLFLSLAIAFAGGWVSAAATDIDSRILAWAALATLLNVITQQLIVSGYILPMLMARFSTRAAVIVTAVLFSFMHAGAFGGSAIPPLNVFGAGLLFCSAYAMTENFWFPVAIHFAWNFLLGPALGLTVSGSERLGAGWHVFQLRGPELVTGGEFGIEGGAIVTITTGAVIAVLLLVWRRRMRRSRDAP
jgi:membrane protease YdiL (CAAX protease family)